MADVVDGCGDGILMPQVAHRLFEVWQSGFSLSQIRIREWMRCEQQKKAGRKTKTKKEEAEKSPARLQC